MSFPHLIIVNQCCHWAYIYATSSLLDPFHCLRASLAHFFLLGHLRPIFFPWASSAHSNSAFPWVFANSFGFPRPNYHILYLWGSWAFHQPLTYLLHYFGPTLAHSCFHTAHGFTTSYSGSFRPACFLRGSFIIFWAYNPLFLPFGLNGFFSQFTNSFLLILLGYWAFLPK